jgi:hypothetical protein
MSLYLDLETDRWHDEDEGRDHVDWLTLKLDGRRVSFHCEHLWRDGTRRVDPEAGISFRTTDLDAVIDALVRLRNELPKGTDT